MLVWKAMPAADIYKEFAHFLLDHNSHPAVSLWVLATFCSEQNGNCWLVEWSTSWWWLYGFGTGIYLHSFLPTVRRYVVKDAIYLRSLQHGQLCLSRPSSLCFLADKWLVISMRSLQLGVLSLNPTRNNNC